MSFVAKHIIGQDERLVGVARLHAIHLVIGVFWSLVIIVFGFFLAGLMAEGNEPGFVTPAVTLGHYTFAMTAAVTRIVFEAIAGMLFIAYYMAYISTEVALTSKRIIHKRGLIAIEVQEIDLAEVQAASIDHRAFGSFFDYGAVKLDCKFVGDVFLPVIRRPYRFLRALHKLQEEKKGGDQSNEGLVDAVIEEEKKRAQHHK